MDKASKEKNGERANIVWEENRLGETDDFIGDIYKIVGFDGEELKVKGIKLLSACSHNYDIWDDEPETDKEDQERDRIARAWLRKFNAHRDFDWTQVSTITYKKL